MSAIAPPFKKVLADLCDTIEATGGVVCDMVTNQLYPEADKDWVELATVYMDACDVLGRRPKITHERIFG